MSAVATPSRVRANREVVAAKIEESRERVRQKAIADQLEPDYLFSVINTPKAPVRIIVEPVVNDVAVREIAPAAVRKARKPRHRLNPFLTGIFFGAASVMAAVVITIFILLAL